MHRIDIQKWQHDHAFSHDEPTLGELRTRWVVALTFLMMIIEIVAGVMSGSMALLADGWHMGTHATAMGVALFAYSFARRHARNPDYSFGTGKVGSLGGFASAVVLGIVSILVFWESVSRIATPIPIHFNEAIFVAVIGLIVNVVSAGLLHVDHSHTSGHPYHTDEDHHDHNLRGAYLHVLADALTSFLAILALTAGKYLSWVWMDPMMGVVGSVVIARWSLWLLRDTSAVLLDAEVSLDRREKIQNLLEADEDSRLTDLHLWRIGPRHLAAIISIVAHKPRPAATYKDRLSQFSDLAHITVEVHQCTDTSS